MSTRRFMFLIAIGVSLIAFMVCLGKRDLLLILGWQQVSGRITKVNQPPPGFIRASDYEIEYEFIDEGGVLRSGADVLPPAKPPPAGGVIEIGYSLRNPTVSRIESQLSTTPLAGVFLGVGLLIWSSFRFVKARWSSPA